MPHPLIADDSFPPGRNEPCFCGSGKRFKHCCGLRSEARPPPHGISIVEDFLARDERQALVGLVDTLQGDPFKVRDRTRNFAPTLDPTRVAERVVLGASQLVLDDLVRRAFATEIIPRTGRAIDWYEQPQLLRYTAGGFYLYHSDAYDYSVEHGAWRKAVDRDLSLLIYLNDGYTGGELDFKRLAYTLKPRAGMLIWFPSDMRYEHMAKVVTTGCRYAIVSWAAFSGVERVRAAPPARAIAWETRARQPIAG